MLRLDGLFTLPQPSVLPGVRVEGWRRVAPGEEGGGQEPGEARHLQTLCPPKHALPPTSHDVRKVSPTGTSLNAVTWSSGAMSCSESLGEPGEAQGEDTPHSRVWFHSEKGSGAILSPELPGAQETPPLSGPNTSPGVPAHQHQRPPSDPFPLHRRQTSRPHAQACVHICIYVYLFIALNTSKHSPPHLDNPQEKGFKIFFSLCSVFKNVYKNEHYDDRNLLKC